MKVLLLILLFPGVALAQWQVSLRKVSSQGLEEIQFKLDRGQWIYRKTSNIFDSKTDLRLGEFKPLKPAIFKEWPSILETIEKNHLQTQQLLINQGAKADWLNPPPHHEPHIVLNGKTINARTPAFEALSILLVKQTEADYSLINGVEVSSDKKELHFREKEKISRKAEFNKKYFCDSVGKGFKCSPERWGLLHLGPDS